jgi:hypothetical protein
MTDDRHSPTTAAPSPTPATEPAPPPVGPPPLTTVVASPSGTATPEQQSELPFGIPPDRPEILVGAAFAGGLVAAFILRRLGGD